MSRALVLSGGGSKGAYQVGALQHWMGALGLDYDVLCGTSVGAINAAYLAQIPLGHPTDAVAKLIAMWQTVETKKVYKRWFPFGRLHALWRRSVYDSTPVQRWIREGLDVKAVSVSGRKLRVVATSFHTGEVRVVDETAVNLADWVIASSAFPVMLSPIQIDGTWWTDGGLRDVTPLGEAFRAGATEIDMILCSDPWAPSGFADEKAHALPQYTMRSIDVMNDEVSRGDLDVALLKNDLSEMNAKYRHVPIRVLQPKTPLPYDSLDFSPASIEAMMARGRADAVALEAGVTASK